MWDGVTKHYWQTKSKKQQKNRALQDTEAAAPNLDILLILFAQDITVGFTLTQHSLDFLNLTVWQRCYLLCPHVEGLHPGPALCHSRDTTDPRGRRSFPQRLTYLADAGKETLEEHLSVHQRSYWQRYMLVYNNVIAHVFVTSSMCESFSDTWTNSSQNSDSCPSGTQQWTFKVNRGPTGLLVARNVAIVEHGSNSGFQSIHQLKR